MAVEVREFQPTIPAGTPQATPVTVALSFPPRVVRRVEVQIPSGPRGVMGFQLGLAGRQLIPYNPGAWIVGDGVSLAWDLDDVPTSGAWQLIGYNTGANPHTVYLRFFLDLATAADPLAPALALQGQVAALGGLTQQQAESAQLTTLPGS